MEQFLGQIQAFGFNFPPKGWAFCDGTILSIAQNTALFSLLGTAYGGNGQTTFGLPDLRGRSIVHPGIGPGLQLVNQGQAGGTESITLIAANMPAHTHAMNTVTARTVIATTSGSPINETDGNTLGFGTGGTFPNMYSESTPDPTNYVGGVSTSLSGTPSISGGNLPFSSRSPYLGVYMSIALVGIFPSRN